MKLKKIVHLVDLICRRISKYRYKSFVSPKNNPVYFLPIKLIFLQGLKSLPKSIKLVIELILLQFEKRETKRELETQLKQSINSFDAQAASVLSRAELVVGAKLSNKVNKELFELNKTSINDLFRSQEEYITASKNLVDAMVDKNLSFYQMLAKFRALIRNV